MGLLKSMNGQVKKFSLFDLMFWGLIMLKSMNEQVKKFSLFDLKLAQVVAMFFGLIVAKLIPQIMDINVWWFVILLVIYAMKPFYVFWIK